MSQGDPIEHAEAYATALRVVGELTPGCARVAIAGSLRRRKPQVRDIEIVAIPRAGTRPAGLGLDEEPFDALEELLTDLIGVGSLKARPVDNHRSDGSIDVQFKLGPAYKALVTGTGVPVDLFVVRPPAQWGVIFGLRTGPGDWNTRLVTECKTIGRRVDKGQVQAWSGSLGRWEPVPTPEESDFFRAVGQPWVHPELRGLDQVAIRRDVAEGRA